VGPRACLDDVQMIKILTLPGLELRPLERPARSQSLHRLLRKYVTKIRVPLGTLSSWVKWLERETDHSSPASVAVKNTWI
jgi:hypothetical protein